jgi:hypothetical protein
VGAACEGAPVTIVPIKAAAMIEVILFVFVIYFPFPY